MINKIAKKLNKKGFTLVELIVVIAILAVLAAIAIPTFNGLVKESRQKALISDARTIATSAQILVTSQEVAGTAASPSVGVNDALSKAELQTKYATGDANIVIDSTTWKVTEVGLKKGDASVTWRANGSNTVN